MSKPYVYQLTHLITGEFYFGSRWANKVEAEDDLGFEYFSSSTHPLIKEHFDEFKIIIISKHENADEAIMAEQTLIDLHWNNPLILNRAKWVNPKFKCVGHSENTKTKMSTAKKGKAPNNKGKPMSESARAKLSKRMKEQQHTEERRLHMTIQTLGNRYGVGNRSRKGLKNSPEMNKKISKSLTGRKMPAMTVDQKKLLASIAKQRPKVCCLLCQREITANSFTLHIRSHQNE